MKLTKHFIIILFIGIILILTACGNERNIKQFYANERGKYTLFIVGDDKIGDSELAKDEYRNKISSIYVAQSLEAVQKDFAFLKIEESPAYVVFDHEKILYKTYDGEELLSYLEKVK